MSVKLLCLTLFILNTYYRNWVWNTCVPNKAITHALSI